MPGHATNTCRTLKNMVQDLIDSEIVNDPEKKPNVKANLLPKYQNIPPIASYADLKK